MLLLSVAIFMGSNPPVATSQEASGGWATVEVTLSGGIDASTYSSGSFVVSNQPDSEANIEEITFDLRGALVTDAVFDPDGTAGDPVGKGFTADSGSTSTGLSGHTFGSPNGEGYDTLTVSFDDFAPGEALDAFRRHRPYFHQRCAPAGTVRIGKCVRP
ncbi:MAG: hypothetical protein U5Q44_09360 [Dehalococcoidia bacterium]|nr:hypothetical protein [Dehalococcoidia bacterium]